jgi:hypothetical protein
METTTFQDTFTNYNAHFKSVDDDWNPDEASCYTLINDQWTLVEQAGNPYELLHNFVYHGLDGTSAMTMHGWGAPLTENDNLTETRPSQHPERRRCRVHIAMIQGEWETAVVFSDKADQLDYMGEQGIGGIADEIHILKEQFKFANQLDEFNKDL